MVIATPSKWDYVSSPPQLWVKFFSRKQSKKESKPQHGQPCHKFLPLKLYILGKGPRWSYVVTYIVSKHGLVRREGKNGLLMHASITAMLSLFSSLLSLFPFFFFFTYLLLLSFLLLSFRVLVLPSMAISSFYSELIQWDFSLLSLRLHQPLLVSYGYSFKTTHNPLVAQPLPLLRVCLLLHSPFQDKNLLCFVSPFTFPTLPNG